MYSAPRVWLWVVVLIDVLIAHKLGPLKNTSYPLLRLFTKRLVRVLLCLKLIERSGGKLIKIRTRRKESPVKILCIVVNKAAEYRHVPVRKAVIINKTGTIAHIRNSYNKAESNEKQNVTSDVKVPV